MKSLLRLNTASVCFGKCFLNLVSPPICANEATCPERRDSSACPYFIWFHFLFHLKKKVECMKMIKIILSDRSQTVSEWTQCNIEVQSRGSELMDPCAFRGIGMLVFISVFPLVTGNTLNAVKHWRPFSHLYLTFLTLSRPLRLPRFHLWRPSLELKWFTPGIYPTPAS